MGLPKKSSNHESIAKTVEKSVKQKPARAVSIIERALLQQSKKFPAETDKEMQEHVKIVGELCGVDVGHSTFKTPLAKVGAPPKVYKQVKGKYGVVSAKLVQDLCEAETNVTEDKIKDACDTAAAKVGASGVKELTGHKKYKAELKITGASKRLYATKAKSGAAYTFDVLAKHT